MGKVFKCSMCGGKLDYTPGVSVVECPWCGVYQTLLDSVQEMPAPIVNQYVNEYRRELSADPDNKELNYSVAVCFMKLKMYDKAIEAFEKAMVDNFDNPETFYNAAICLLHGQKAFVQTRQTIEKIVEYVNAALMIREAGIYYYFMAYIKYDYFSRKYLNTSPDYREMLRKAAQCGCTQKETDRLFTILGVPKPEGF